MRRTPCIVAGLAALGGCSADALECSAIASANAVASCQARTGFAFSKEQSVDVGAFCRDENCRALWRELEQLDALACFRGFKSEGYSLENAASARRCFSHRRSSTEEDVVIERQLQAAPGNGTESSGQTKPNLESATINGAGPSSAPPPPPSEPTTKNNTEVQATSMKNVWIALGGCGAGVVLLVILSITIRRRKAKEMEAKVLDCLDHSVDYIPTIHSSRSRPSRNDSVSSDTNFGQSRTHARSRSKRSPRLACLDDDLILAVRIPYGKLTISTLVSRGGFGEVYRGMYRSKVVAIKRLLPEKRHEASQIENFLLEAKLMVSLEHEHIVRFVGVAWESIDDLCVITEYMDLGDLRTLLWKYDVDEEAHPKGFNADKLKIALHVAKALTYMHSLQPVVLHRDVKSRNILLDSKLDAKVTDFGVSRERADSTMTTGVGSTLWMAPEVMTGGRYNEKADVFSFGVVLSELDTHSIPYAHAVEPRSGRRLPDTVIVQMMTLSRISVEFTNENESPMAQLGRRCVQLDPAKRPTAKEAQEMIHELWKNVVVAL